MLNAIPETWQNTSEIFIALGDVHRQQMLLTIHANKRMNILQIVQQSNLSRTAVTHHLNVLKKSGALHSEKIGKEVFFWVNDQLITQSLNAVTKFLSESMEP